MKEKKTAKPVKPCFDAKKYVDTKGWLNYGLPTMVICGVIYYFLKAGPMPLIAVGADIWLSVFITIFICSATGIPGIRADIRKGAAPRAEFPKWEHPVYRHFSDNLVVQSIQFALLSTVLFGFGLGGLLAVIAVMGGDMAMAFHPVVYWIGKSIYSGVFVALTLRWVTACTLSQYCTGKEL